MEGVVGWMGRVRICTVSQGLIMRNTSAQHQSMFVDVSRHEGKASTSQKDLGPGKETSMRFREMSRNHPVVSDKGVDVDVDVDVDVVVANWRAL